MRTITLLIVGLFLFAAIALFSKLFTNYYPASTTWGLSAFLAIWLAATGFNLWVGVSHAGYSVSEELPIMLLLYSLPAAVAIAIKWRFL